MERIARTSLVDTVVAKLRDEIRTGNWPVGCKIPTEAKLVGTPGVSRPSVREAVRGLVQLGLLEARQGDGTSVIADDETTVALKQVVGAADMGEAQVVRHGLDMLAARVAATRRTGADINALRAALLGRRAAKTTTDLLGFIAHDVAFHVGVVRAAHNALLLDFYKSFEGAMRDPGHAAICMAAIEDPHDEYHDELFLAILRGDGRAAAQAAFNGLDRHELCH
jgi:DNA-binding FadR family transcriptional regulator